MNQVHLLIFLVLVLLLLLLHSRTEPRHHHLPQEWQGEFQLATSHQIPSEITKVKQSVYN